mmetsp:Transcript_56138/g.156358  ORF Transcript_56138/g.156358 Transcript_56138/m.156358 type:complete len:200 (+) Transcript_56138:450-1049(+)
MLRVRRARGDLVGRPSDVLQPFDLRSGLHCQPGSVRPAAAASALLAAVGLDGGQVAPGEVRRDWLLLALAPLRQQHRGLAEPHGPLAPAGLVAPELGQLLWSPVAEVIDLSSMEGILPAVVARDAGSAPLEDPLAHAVLLRAHLVGAAVLCDVRAEVHRGGAAIPAGVQGQRAGRGRRERGEGGLHADGPHECERSVGR